MIEKLSQTDFESRIASKYTDVINAKLGGKVVAYSDQFFAEAKNLINPQPPVFDPHRYVETGKWYDGWETRRHNTEEADWVVFRLGATLARLIGCEVDTAHFKGNHAPAISVEAYRLAEEEELEKRLNPSQWEWLSVIPKTECGPSQRHFLALSESTENSFTHVRLCMYPDGGIARFRLYGNVTFDAEAVHASITMHGSLVLDVAAAVHGGVATAASNQNFSPASNLLLPGRGHDMLDGWETLRLREPGHVDWAEVRLGARTRVQRIVVDTAHFRGNFPPKINVRALDYSTGEFPPHSEWDLIVPDVKILADLEHEFVVKGGKTYTHVVLTLIPDGGVKRLRVFGEVTL